VPTPPPHVHDSSHINHDDATYVYSKLTLPYSSSSFSPTPGAYHCPPVPLSFFERPPVNCSNCYRSSLTGRSIISHPTYDS
jgi:hypothetical protein